MEINEDYNYLDEVQSQGDNNFEEDQSIPPQQISQQIQELESSLLSQSTQLAIYNQQQQQMVEEQEKAKKQIENDQKSQQNKKHVTQKYLEDKLFPFLNMMMIDVLREQPEDFVAYSLQWLSKVVYDKQQNSVVQTTCSSLHSQSTDNSMQKKKTNYVKEIDLRLYLTEKVDWILEELVLNVVHNLPKDPIEFTISWLKKKEKEMQVDLKTEIGASGLYIKTMKPIKNYMLTKSIFAEALKDLSCKKSEAESTYGLQHPQYARQLQNLGRLYQEAGKYEKAMSYFMEALQLLEKYFGPEYDDVAENLLLIGDLMEDLQNYQEAQKMYERALLIKEKIYGIESLQKIQMLLFLGRVIENQGHFGKAQILYKKSLFLIQKNYQFDDPMVAKPFEYMGNALINSGKYHEALKYYRRALKFYKKDEGLDYVAQISLLYNMAIALERVNQLEEALSTLQIVYKTAIKEIPNHPAIEKIEDRLAKLDSILSQ